MDLLDQVMTPMGLRKRRRLVLLAVALSLGPALVSCRPPASLSHNQILRALKTIKKVPQTSSRDEFRYDKKLDFPNFLEIQKNIVLISLDTLRADRLNCYGYAGRVTSPEIDLLARHGILFESCIIHSPGTLSSQMSLLTGYYPTVHGITYRKTDELQKKLKSTNQPVTEDYYYRLPAISDRMFTLAEILKVHGFQTVGVHEGGYLSAPLGYACGFDRFICSQTSATYGEEGKRTEGLKKTFSIAEEVFDSLREPFLFFFHTYEIHAPYIHDHYALAENRTIGQGEYFSACYDGGILYADGYIEKLMAVLERKKIRDRTIVVLTSDHGEEFGDHYPIWNGGHGESQYQEQIRVPLIIVDPTLGHRSPGGKMRTIAEPVECVDIVPTILDLALGRDYADTLLSLPELKRNGQSLAPFFSSGHRVQKAVYFEDSYFGPERMGIISEGMKFIIIPHPQEVIAPDQWPAEIMSALLKTPAQEMFFLAGDSREKFNIVEQKKGLAQRMEKAVLDMRRQLERQNKYFRGELRHLDDAVLRQLKSLGYIK